MPIAGPPLFNVDASVLAFLARVLELAEDPRVPLLERVRFLSIFGSNLDEFSITRLAALHDQVARGSNRPGPDGLSPAALLDWLAPAMRQLLTRASELWQAALVAELRGAGIDLVPPRAWQPADREALHAWATAELHPRLVPLGVGRDLASTTHIRSLRPTFLVEVEDGCGERRT